VRKFSFAKKYLLGLERAYATTIRLDKLLRELKLDEIELEIGLRRTDDQAQ
jgi:hypothetical protein